MNILTFDIEEWFHILDNNSTKTASDWDKYEARIHENMDRIFDFILANQIKATFFVVGWIAEKYPEIVKKIDQLGFEIGSHTHMHQLMYEQTKKEVESDLYKSIQTLQEITGKKVKSFRAPGFSITKKNKWVFEILYRNGIEYDSSIFPASRAHGGLSSFPKATPSKLIIEGAEIKEFPINTASILGYKWIFSGGGYFRLTPYNLIHSWTKESNYIMAYFHPRDFDYEQPTIQELSFFRKFKSYYGLKSCLPKLEKWVNDFEFIDLSSANNTVDWNNAPRIIIN
jgi:polysaccharide deacetylase family protein (PEP-CTERM system associated)